MNRPPPDHRRRLSPESIILATLVLAVAIAVGTWALRGPAYRAASDGLPGDGLRVRLAVEPFEVGDSVPADWSSTGFADSLAVQLSLIRGIHAAPRLPDAQYVLHGHVTMKDARLILATRLAREGARDTVWTATFWRSATSSHSVLTDLAQAVAEAVFNESVREPFTQKREKP